MASEQATALQHTAKTTQEGPERLETLAGANEDYFKLKTPNVPQKSLANCVEARAFLSEQIFLQENQLQGKSAGIVRVRAGSKGGMEREDGGGVMLSRSWASLCACGMLPWVQDSPRSNRQRQQRGERSAVWRQCGVCRGVSRVPLSPGTALCFRWMLQSDIHPNSSPSHKHPSKEDG